MRRTILLLLTLMFAGRAMTLAFIHRAGGSAPGDPPAAWLMPLIGDAVIGLSALFMAFLIWKKRGLWVWATLLAWNAVAIWDGLSAYLIHLTAPWPEFFMIKTLGPTMFFAASAMHLGAILLICHAEMRQWFLGTEFGSAHSGVE